MPKTRLVLFLILMALVGSALVTVAALAPPTSSASEGGATYTFQRRERVVPSLQDQQLAVSPRMQALMAALSASHLKNVTISYEQAQVTGSLVSAEDRSLLVRVGDRLVTILASRSWLVGGEVKSLLQLFIDKDINKGDNVSVEALKIALTSPNRPTIVVYIATKINDSTTNRVI